MAFIEHRALSTPPDRYCDDLLGGLSKAFPPKTLAPHEQAGYSFRSKPCVTAQAYNPDYCLPGDMKMNPEHFGVEKFAILGMVQSALNCTFGVDIEELRVEAENAINYNIWRAIDNDLVNALAVEAVSQTPAPLQALCVLAEASQFLVSKGNCGNGVIVGPLEWFLQLSKDYLVWNGQFFTDLVGNIVVPLEIDNDTVYAFDSTVEIRLGEVQLLDEPMPGQRTVNDRIVRAEQVYTVAFDACVVGSFQVSDCCGCASGGGGGGGPSTSVAVTNFPSTQPVSLAAPVAVSNFPPFPANQPVTVTNFPATSPEFNAELVTLCDSNGPFLRRFTYDESTGLPTTVVTTDLSGAAYTTVGTVGICPANTNDPTVQSHHFDVVSGSPYTAASLPAGRLVSLSYTVLAGSVTTVDQDGTSIAGIPTGYTGEWQVQTDLQTLAGPISITADSPTSRAIVTIAIANP